jgi:hypothetical protein
MAKPSVFLKYYFENHEDKANIIKIPTAQAETLNGKELLQLLQKDNVDLRTISVIRYFILLKL